MARFGRDYGSFLLGSADMSPRRLRIRIQILLTAAVVTANLIGIAIAISLAGFGIPEPSVFTRELILVNFLAVPVYASVALIIGVSIGTVMMVRALRWSILGETPTPADARRAVRAQRRLVLLQLVLWFGAAAMLGLLYGLHDPELIPKAVLVVAMSGAVVAAVSNLFTDVLLRPVWAKILQAGLGLRGKSVRWQAVMSWAIGSGIPLAGILLVVFFSTYVSESSRTSLFVSVTVLVAIAVAVGLLAVYLFAWTVTGPIRSVRDGMARVRTGDVSEDVDVIVYDGSELGEMQYGFNTMIAGLREEERLRDIFGRHVGRDVAAAAMRADPQLGGTAQTVAVVFVDVMGSTELAAERPPEEVVTLLNRFFAVIVEATESNRGLVNKFEGDAVLSIFGAPIGLDDPAGAALRAAREIAQRLAAEVPELQAGIGVSYGPVVAGNVGAIQRFEYTVIGDPVNESARISEIAKRDPRRPWAAQRAIAAAAPGEAARWKLETTEVLRGRDAATEIFVARVIPYAPHQRSGDDDPRAETGDAPRADRSND